MDEEAVEKKERRAEYPETNNIFMAYPE